MLIQAARRAILGFRERTLDCRLPTRLCCLQFAREVPVQGRFRRRERRFYLLLNLVGGRDQRVALGGGILFVLPRCFLKRFCRSLRLPRDLRLRLFSLCLQPRCRVLAVLTGLPQRIRHAFQLLPMFITLSCTFAGKPFCQIAGELLELWREPARQFGPQGLGRCRVRCP